MIWNIDGGARDVVSRIKSLSVIGNSNCIITSVNEGGGITFPYLRNLFWRNLRSPREIKRLSTCLKDGLHALTYLELDFFYHPILQGRRVDFAKDVLQLKAGRMVDIFPNLADLRLSACVLSLPLELAHAVNLTGLRTLRLLQCTNANKFFAAIVEAGLCAHLSEFVFRSFSGHSTDEDSSVKDFISSFRGLVRLYLDSFFSEDVYSDYVTAIRCHKESLRQLSSGGMSGGERAFMHKAVSQMNGDLKGMDLECWQMPSMTMQLVFLFLTLFH